MTLNIFRDRTSYLSRTFMLSLFIPFIIVFLGHLGKDQTSVQDRVGLLYQSSQVPPFVAALNAIGLCKSPIDEMFNSYVMIKYIHVVESTLEF